MKVKIECAHKKLFLLKIPEPQSRYLIISFGLVERLWSFEFAAEHRFTVRLCQEKGVGGLWDGSRRGDHGGKTTGGFESY